MPADADYANRLRPLLPDAAFRPAPRKLAIAGLHVAVAVLGWLAITGTPMPYWPLAALAIGTSLGAIAFLAHEISHRSPVRNRVLAIAIETVLWSLLLMPRTVWRRVHRKHHLETNAADDPDRRFLPGEMSPAVALYARMFFPNRQWRYSAVCFLHFIAYSIRHSIAAFGARPRQIALVTAAPAYSRRERATIAGEIAVIVALQLAIWLIVRGEGGLHGVIAYVFASLLPITLMSAVVSFYFFTNHGLKPIGDGADALAGSTSVVVPQPFDWLHSNFSYHTEHHLFPTMNSDYYPLVSELLRRDFGARYQRLPVGGAWKALLRSEVAAARARPTGLTPASPAVAGGTDQARAQVAELRTAE